MSPAAIDRATYDGLVESTGDDFVCELVDTFLAEAPRMLDELRDAYAKDDAERFRRAAHSLKSNANTFGALTLGAFARDLELAGVAQVRDRGAQPLAELNAEYSRVAAQLRILATT